MAVVGNEVFYTELSPATTFGPTDSIHVAPFNNGAGGSDIRTIPNPAPSTGVQDLDYANGALYVLSGYYTGSLQVWKLDPTSGAVLAGPIAINSDPSADGFTVLPNGIFLINTGDGSCTYDAYDPTTGAATGASITVPGASFCTGVATDGTSLYFETDSSSFTQTDLAGNLISRQSVPDNFVEDISLVSTVPPPALGITLAPASTSGTAGQSVALTATVADSSGAPTPGVSVTLTVQSGADAGATLTGTTDSSGQAVFSLRNGGQSGTDVVQASFTDASGQQHTSNTATVQWTGGGGCPTCLLTYHGPVAHGTLGGFLPGVNGTLGVDGTHTPTVTLSQPIAPCCKITIPNLYSVTLTTSVGSFELNPFTLQAQGSPQSSVVANPSGFPYFSYAHPSLSDLKGALSPKGGNYVIPLGTVSRDVTSTFANIMPLKLVTKLALEFKLSISWPQWYVYATAAVVVVVAAPEIVAALSELGIGVAVTAVADAISSVIVPVLEGAAGTIVVGIPGALAGAAGAVWSDLSGSPVFAFDVHRARVAGQVSAGPPRVSKLRVFPLRRADLRRRRLQAVALRGALASAAYSSLVPSAVKAAMRPLVVNTRAVLGRSRTLVMLGGDLPGKRAELAIAGPGYHAVRAVRITHGLAGGRVLLPRGHHGHWYVGIVDYAGLHLHHGRVRGRALLEAASFVR